MSSPSDRHQGDDLRYRRRVALAGVSDYCDLPGEDPRGPACRHRSSTEPRGHRKPRAGSDRRSGGAGVAALDARADRSHAQLAVAHARQRRLERPRARRDRGAAHERRRAGGSRRDGPHEPRDGRRASRAPRDGVRCGRRGSVWFERKNSLHGMALEAAGGRNVVDEHIHAPPALSIERVLQLDPDPVIPLVNAPGPSDRRWPRPSRAGSGFPYSAPFSAAPCVPLRSPGSPRRDRTSSRSSTRSRRRHAGRPARPTRLLSVHAFTVDSI